MLIEGFGEFGVAGGFCDVATGDEAVGCEEAGFGIVGELAEDFVGFGVFALCHEFCAEAGACGVAAGVGWVLGEEGAEGFDGGVLLAFGPLAGGEEEHGATGGGGSVVVFDDALEGCEVVRLVEGGSCGGFLALLDAAVDDDAGDAKDPEDAEDHEVFLVAIEELLEGAWAVGDFCEGAWGVWAVGGHGKWSRDVAGRRSKRGLRRNQSGSPEESVFRAKRRFAGFFMANGGGWF